MCLSAIIFISLIFSEHLKALQILIRVLINKDQDLLNNVWFKLQLDCKFQTPNFRNNSELSNRLTFDYKYRLHCRSLSMVTSYKDEESLWNLADLWTSNKIFINSFRGDFGYIGWPPPVHAAVHLHLHGCWQQAGEMPKPPREQQDELSVVTAGNGVLPDDDVHDPRLQPEMRLSVQPMLCLLHEEVQPAGSEERLQEVAQLDAVPQGQEHWGPQKLQLIKSKIRCAWKPWKSEALN